MTDDIYDKLHQAWPDLELSVCVHGRQAARVPANRQMDIRLLSSPLLVKLQYTVYSQGYRANQKVRSEWPKFIQAVVAGNSVRFLQIQTEEDGNESEYRGVQIIGPSEPKHLARPEILPNIRLSQLEELSITAPHYWGGSTYLWDTDHCSLLRDALDLSRLRTLDFGNDSPNALFTAFRGLIPNLEAIRFGVVGSVEAARQLIESASALKSLDIARILPVMDTLWPAIQKHKGSLTTLVLRPTIGSYCSPCHMDFGLLEKIASFPALQRLGWDIPCNTNVHNTTFLCMSFF